MLKNLAIITILICGAIAMNDVPVRKYLAQKNQLVKSDIFGRTVSANLQARGEGISADEEVFVASLIAQAERTYYDDQYSTALFLQDRIESAWGSRWNVEVFGEDPSWGRATHIENERWLLFFGYGSYSWDFIIWKPLC